MAPGNVGSQGLGTLVLSVCNVRSPHLDLLSGLLYDQTSHQPDRNSALTVQWPGEDDAFFANTVNSHALNRRQEFDLGIFPCCRTSPVTSGV